jgi:fructosamine-3-kinase
MPARGGASAEPAELLQGELRRATGEADLVVLGLERVSGGCIHEAVRVRTDRGDFFAKWNARSPPDLFPSEAEGLRALRASASGLVVPEVLAAAGPRQGRPGFIVMEYLAPGGGLDETALARGLAALHRVARDGFGFQVTTYCGPTPQDNRPAESWPEFYGQRRLRPLVRQLESAGRIGGGERRIVERVIDRLPALLAHGARASLIHGDLWSGNVLATARGAALVDPACAVCDPELEFGITTLFGGFSERFFAAYLEALPLPDGWRERNPLYQLYHLLNHHLIFGGHYGSEALAIARRFG